MRIWILQPRINLLEPNYLRICIFYNWVTVFIGFCATYGTSCKNTCHNMNNIKWFSPTTCSSIWVANFVFLIDLWSFLSWCVCISALSVQSNNNHSLAEKCVNFWKNSNRSLIRIKNMWSNCIHWTIFFSYPVFNN